MPRARFTPWPLLPVLVGLVQACTGEAAPGAPKVDAARPDAVDVRSEDTAPPDRSPPDAAPPPDFALPDVTQPPDFGPPPTAVPLPPGVAAPRRFLAPGESLTGSGQTSCSHQDPPSVNGERWCVFTRGPSSAPNELWVIDLNKVVAGALPRCDGTSPDCLRLTTTLWTGFSVNGPAHPYSHQFEGDTLLFYADASSAPGQPFRGPVRAWRPGWNAPRQLTSDAGLLCYGHSVKPVAHCLDDVRGDPMKPDSLELRAGSVATPPAAPLPSAGRFRPHRADGAISWQAGFSPDGSHFAVSSADPDPAVETLQVVATADIGRQPLRVAVQRATSWAIGNDSRRLYFLRDEDSDQQGLYAADFPDGSNEVKLGGRVTDYLLLGDGAKDEGISYLMLLGGDRTAFRITRDTTMPMSTQTIFTYRDFLEDLHMSGDLRFTAWLDAGFNARVVRHDDLTSCRLNTNLDAAAFEPLFLHSAGLIFWNEDRTDTDLRDAFYARPSDCQMKRKFAEGIGYYQPIGDKGLVFTDEKDPRERMTLKYAAAIQTPDGWRLDTPVRVQDKLAYGYFTVLRQQPPVVIFKTTESDGGTFVFGPLPF